MISETLNGEQAAALAMALEWVAPWLAIESERCTDGSERHAFLWDGARVEVTGDAAGQWRATANGAPMPRRSAARLYEIATFVRWIAIGDTHEACQLILGEKDVDRLGAAQAWERAYECRPTVLLVLADRLGRMQPGVAAIGTEHLVTHCMEG